MRKDSFLIHASPTSFSPLLHLNLLSSLYSCHLKVLICRNRQHYDHGTWRTCLFLLLRLIILRPPRPPISAAKSPAAFPSPRPLRHPLISSHHGSHQATRPCQHNRHVLLRLDRSHVLRALPRRFETPSTRFGMGLAPSLQNLLERSMGRHSARSSFEYRETEDRLHIFRNRSISGETTIRDTAKTRRGQASILPFQAPAVYSDYIWHQHALRA